MNGTVNISDFMQHLRDEGLVIIKATELAETTVLKTTLEHRDLLRKKMLPVSAAAKVLGVGNTTVMRWINEGKITKGEVFRAKNKRISIMTSAVKRLQGYEK